MKVLSGGRVVSDDPGMVNACSILGIHPPLLRALREGKGPITVAGSTEIWGSVYSSHVTHTVIGRDSPTGLLRIKSETVGPDDRFHLTTLTKMGKDGIPLESKTTGTIRKGFIDLQVDLKMVRTPTPPQALAKSE